MSETTNIKMSKLSVGDKVEILRLDIGTALQKKAKPLYGRVMSIDGYYIMVKPRYQRYIIELYPNEIKQLN